MSLTRFAIVFMFTFSSIISFGQAKSKEAKVKWTQEQKESRRSTLSGIIGKDRTGIYALKREANFMSASTFTIEHYDNNMKLLTSTEFNLKEGRKVKFFEGSIMSKGNLYIFSSFRNKGSRINYFFKQSVNLKTLKLNNDLEEIAQINFKGFSKYNAGGFLFDTSRDSSKFLVYYDRPYEKEEKEEMGIIVFDQDLNKIYNKDITLPYEDQLYRTQDFIVDNKGNFHILGKLFKDKPKNTRKGKPNYFYQVLSYYDNGETREKYPIEVTGKYLNDMQLAIDANGNLACGGFYATNASFNVDGSYWLKIDAKTKEIVSKNFKEFSIDFITQNMKARKEKKYKRKEAKGKEIELYRYYLDDIIFHADGGSVLIGEQFFITTSISSDQNGQSTTIVRYHFNDIIVVKVNKAGEIEWAKKIPKVQVSINDGGFYSSYHLSVVRDKLYFVFNDNPKNLFNKGDGKLKNYVLNKECLTVLVTMDSKGDFKKEALFDTREAEVYIRPKVGRQVGFRETILFGQKRKIQKLAKVTFR